MDYQPLYGRLFALIFVIAYLAYLFITVRWTARGLATLWWRQTDATITRSEIEINITQDEVYHIPQIVYNFEAGGQRFNGQRIAPVGRYAKLGKAEIAYALLAQYPVGKTVTVHYPPDHPELAVLKSGLGLSWLLRYAAFIIIPVVTLSLFVTAEGPLEAIVYDLTLVNERLLPITEPIAAFYGLGEQDTPVILGGLFLLMVTFLPLVFVTLRILARLLMSFSWRQVDGEVISTRVQDFYRGNGSNTVHYFRPVVLYRYRVDDKDYTSTRLSWGGRERDERRRGLFPGRRAEGVIRRYPVGASVSVRYDPAHPYIAALAIRIPYMRLLLYILVIIAVILVLIHPQDMAAFILRLMQPPPPHLRPI